MKEKIIVNMAISPKLIGKVSYTKLVAILSKIPVEILWGNLIQIAISNGRMIFKSLIRKSISSLHLV